MKNRERGSIKETAQWGVDLYLKKQAGKEGKKSINTQANENIHLKLSKYAPPLHDPGGGIQNKVALVEDKTFRKDVARCVHLLEPMWLHTSAPARSGQLGRSKLCEGPGTGAVTAFCHTTCSITTTRWHFHKMALWIMRPSGRVRRGSWEGGSSFSGCLLTTWNRHLFSSAPFAAYAKRHAGQ